MQLGISLCFCFVLFCFCFRYVKARLKWTRRYVEYRTTSSTDKVQPKLAKCYCTHHRNRRISCFNAENLPTFTKYCTQVHVPTLGF